MGTYWRLRHPDVTLFPLPLTIILKMPETSPAVLEISEPEKWPCSTPPSFISPSMLKEVVTRECGFTTCTVALTRPLARCTEPVTLPSCGRQWEGRRWGRGGLTCSVSTLALPLGGEARTQHGPRQPRVRIRV